MRLGLRRERREQARTLAMTALAAQSDAKHIKAEIERLLVDENKQQRDSDKQRAFLTAMLDKAQTEEIRNRIRKRIEELDAAGH